MTLPRAVPLASSAFAEASSVSMTSLNLASGCAPERLTPLMNEPGVPDTPTPFASLMSRSTLAPHFVSVRSPATSDLPRPASTAHSRSESEVMSRCDSKTRSWNFQNAAGVRVCQIIWPSVAASFAFLCIGSGWFFSTMRRSLPNVSRRGSMWLARRAQNGHWRSVKTTIVTSASTGPICSSSLFTGIGRSS